MTIKMFFSKAVLLFLFALNYLLAGCLGSNVPFYWEDCGKSDRTFIIKDVDISPKPIIFYQKTVLNITGDIITKDTLDNDVTVTLKITRLASSWGFNIPLWYTSNGFCDFLDDPKYNTIFCAILKAAGQSCSCPMKKGHYHVTEAPALFDMNVLPIPTAIIRFGTGNWQMELRANNKEREIGCFRLKTHATMKL
jgi:hypothetical protein